MAGTNLTIQQTGDKSQSDKLTLPARYDQFVIPPGLPARTSNVLEELLRRRGWQNQELEDLATIFCGGDAAMDERYFPKPDMLEWHDWIDLKQRLLVLVNLLKVSVVRLRTAVYGDPVYRVPAPDHPYREKLVAAFGRRYQQRMRCWYENKVLFGESANVVLLNVVDGKPYLRHWLPDPRFTHCIQDSDDAWEYVGIGEFQSDRKVLRFVTADAVGRLVVGIPPVVFGPRDDIGVAECFVQLTGTGFLPAVVGHGEDRRHWQIRENGISLVRDVLKCTIRATDTLLKSTLLMKLQTNALLLLQNVSEQDQARIGEFLSMGILPLSGDKVGGQYLTPNSNIPDALGLLDRIIGITSVTVGVPIEDLDANFSGDQSAEASRRRAVPLTSLSKEQTDLSVEDEKDLCYVQSGLLEWHKRDGQKVILDDLREDPRWHTDVRIEPTVLPETAGERMNVTERALERGIWSADKVARMWNPNASEAEIADRVEAIRGKLQAGKVAWVDETMKKADEEGAEDVA